MKLAVDEAARFEFDPAREGVISWNTFTERGTIEFRILRAGKPQSAWLKYARWNSGGRHSFSPQSDSDGVRVDTDVLRAKEPFDGLDVRADGVEFRSLSFAAPVHLQPSLPYMGTARILDVPARSQYVVEGERGWCSPTSLSMLHAYHGIDHSVQETARNVFDSAYNGTGNWAFNMAYSGALGLRAAVVYLRNLDHAQRLIDAGIPIAISYSWKGDELPGAPIEHSDGHLAVLTGFTSDGDCALNDPAAPQLRVVYPRAAVERIWQRNNGVAYAVAPAGLDFVRIVNA